MVLDTTCPCLGEHQHPRTFSLLASTDMKIDVRVVCASLSPIVTPEVLQRPREQLQGEGASVNLRGETQAPVSKGGECLHSCSS